MLIIDKFLLCDFMFCCRDAAKIMLYIAWGRQGLFIEGGLDVGKYHADTLVLI